MECIRGNIDGQKRRANMQQICKSTDNLPSTSRGAVVVIAKLRHFDIVFDCSLSLEDIVTSRLPTPYVLDTSLPSAENLGKLLSIFDCFKNLYFIEVSVMIYSDAFLLDGRQA